MMRTSAISGLRARTAPHSAATFASTAAGTAKRRPSAPQCGSVHRRARLAEDKEREDNDVGSVA